MRIILTIHDTINSSNISDISDIVNEVLRDIPNEGYDNFAMFNWGEYKANIYIQSENVDRSYWIKQFQKIGQILVNYGFSNNIDISISNDKLLFWGYAFYIVADGNGVTSEILLQDGFWSNILNKMCSNQKPPTLAEIKKNKLK